VDPCRSAGCRKLQLRRRAYFIRRCGCSFCSATVVRLLLDCLLHQLIAGAGAFLLVSSLGWGPAAAAALRTDSVALRIHVFAAIQLHSGVQCSLGAAVPVDAQTHSRRHRGSESVVCDWVRYLHFHAPQRRRPELSVPAMLLMTGFAFVPRCILMPWIDWVTGLCRRSCGACWPWGIGAALACR